MDTLATSKETSNSKQNNLSYCFRNYSNNMHKKIFHFLPILFAIFLGGCAVFDEFLQIGPDSVQDSRGEFNSVIAETNDQQSIT